MDELLALPSGVRRSVGYTLHLVQHGEVPENVKPLRGFKGAGVLEVVEDFDGNTFRAIYTVRLVGAVYVLHCFQKKSKRGIATPKLTMELVRRRLQVAEMMHKKEGTDHEKR